VISHLAAEGHPAAIAFPRAWLGEGNLDFSFSGLKTSVVNHVTTQRRTDQPLALADICASFQEAVVEVLVEKTLIASALTGHSRIVLGGGVAANPRLRAVMQQHCDAKGLQLFMPSPIFCTDNAAMIAVAGYHQFLRGDRVEPDTDAYSRSPLN
jgi:N6-L-threonylcarbamoyladenine synthase